MIPRFTRWEWIKVLAADPQTWLDAVMMASIVTWFAVLAYKVWRGSP